MKNETETIDIDPELETGETPETPVATNGHANPSTIIRIDYVSLEDLTTDGGTQPRADLDPDVIEEYANSIKTARKEGIAAGQTEEEWENPFDKLRDEDLPQVFEDEYGELILASGFTRFAAHKKAGVKDIYCAIRSGTLRDAILYSVGTNVSHGQRRTNKDIKRAVQMLTNDDKWSQWSDAEIARRCHVSPPTVKSYRPAAKTPVTKKITRKGKETTMDTAAIGKGKGKKNADPIVEDATKDKPSKKTPEAKAQELDKMLVKVANNCGEEGGKFRAGVLDGALTHVTMKDVEELASFAPKKQKEVLPLVMGGPRMKPAKAFDFLGSEPNPKVLDELHNRAIAANGKYVFEAEGFTITCELTGK